MCWSNIRTNGCCELDFFKIMTRLPIAHSCNLPDCQLLVGRNGITNVFQGGCQSYDGHCDQAFPQIRLLHQECGCWKTGKLQGLHILLSSLKMRYANLTENKMGHKRGHHCLALFLNPLHNGAVLFALSLSSRCHFLNGQRPITVV